MFCAKLSFPFPTVKPNVQRTAALQSVDTDIEITRAFTFLPFRNDTARGRQDTDNPIHHLKGAPDYTAAVIENI